MKGALDTQSLVQFDVAPWASQMQTTFPSTLVEKPMSIKNAPLANAKSHMKLGGKQRSESRPYARFMQRTDHQGKPLKAFQHTHANTFSRKSSDVYGTKSTNRVSRNYKQATHTHKLSSSKTQQSSQGPMMLISEQTSQMGLEHLGAHRTFGSAKHGDQWKSRNIRVLGTEKKQSVTTMYDKASQLEQASQNKQPESANREGHAYGDAANTYHEQTLLSSQVVSQPGSRKGEHVPAHHLSQQQDPLDMALMNNSDPSSIMEAAAEEGADQRPGLSRQKQRQPNSRRLARNAQ